MEIKKNLSSTILGAVAVVTASLLALPVLAATLFFLWGMAGRAYHFMCGGF